MVVVKGEASEREKRETNAKEDEKFNAKEEEELNAMEEGKLPVRWSWLGEVEEEENSVGTLTVPTASELFSLRSRRNKKEKEEGRRREKRRRKEGGREKKNPSGEELPF